MDLDKDGISSTISVESWSLRFFTGFSVNISGLFFDFTGLYSVQDDNYGASVGMRLQL
jgi:hypothetical protein